MSSQAVRTVREGLTELIRLVNSERATTADVRWVLSESKAMAAQVALLQADSATRIAKAERHGDGGVGVLADAAGVTKRDAAGQVKAGAELQAMPQVRQALTEGKIGLANAKTLARASGETDSTQVTGDSDLLAKAASMTPEQFQRHAKRWAVKRQADSGESEYKRQRAARYLSIWTDEDDGMTYLKGAFDPVTGSTLSDRLDAEVERLRRLDRNGDAADKRTKGQLFADALETLTRPSTPCSHGSSDRCDTNGQHAPAAEITIVQHLDADGDQAFAEIADGGIIPPSVVEQHFCNAKIVGVVFNSKGQPLWRGTSITRPTKAQMDALIARYGGRCAGCHRRSILQTHHIVPLSEGGPTNIDNLIGVCWACHDKIHHHNWQVTQRPGDDLPTLKPPERTRHGPAHAPDRPPTPRPPPNARREAVGIGSARDAPPGGRLW